MAHEVESMMYSGEVPWHRLGVPVDGLQTAEEALIKAGLDWEVALYPVVVNNEVFTKNKAVVRSTDKKVYGIVGDRYTPVQNRESFDFFDGVVGSGQAVYETAGSLKGGARIWILANLKGSMSIAGDEVKKYVTLVNSHDGSMAIQMFWTPIRVVCMNTLSMALSGAADKFYCKHTTRVISRVEAAREILGLATQFYAQWEERAKRLAVLQLPPAKMPLLLRAAFELPESKRMEDVYNPMKVAFQKIEELVEVGRGQRDNPAIRGTAWGAYNAVTEWADYHKSYKKMNADKRLTGAWFGSGMKIKNNAWNWLRKEDF